MAEISRDVFKAIRRIQILTTRAVQDTMAGAYHSAFKGQGMEFEEVREYQPGDDVRSIDWNVTARMDFPYIKSFREERQLTVMLLIDVSASSLFGSGEKGKKEFIAELGAVLSLSAIQNNDRVGLILFSDQVEKYLPPKKGLRHVLRVIRELLVFEPKSRGTDMGVALEFLKKVQRKQAVVFLISDFLAPDCKTQLSLAAKHYDLLGICVTDPQEESFPQMGLLPVRDLETGEWGLVDTQQAEVQEHLRKRFHTRLSQTSKVLRKMGGDFLHLRTNQPYAHALGAFFEQRKRRQR